MSKLPLAIGLVLLQAAMLARAQADDHEPQDTREPPALAGPSIEPGEQRTLVVYEYGGGLQDLGLPPAEAALELLDLDEKTGERVAHVLAERAMLAERLIIENFDLVSQGDTVNASDNKLAKGIFFLQVVEVLKPLIDRGPLEDEIRPLLPAERGAAFDRLLEQYWRALGRARVEESRKKGGKLTLRRAMREARRDQLGKEVELAAQRAIESEEFAVGYLTRGLDLTEAQEARIRELVTDFAARSMGDAGEESKERLFIEVLAYLNERQREALLERIRGL